jgi:hypothetical protein
MHHQFLHVKGQLLHVRHSLAVSNVAVALAGAGQRVSAQEG